MNLTKNAFMHPSDIHGYGLVSRGVARGEIVDESPVLILPGVPEELVSHVWCLGEDGWALPLGDGVFVNHSSAPNAVAHIDMDRRVAVIRAKRCIDYGEEVTVDYGPTWSGTEPRRRTRQRPRKD